MTDALVEATTRRPEPDDRRFRGVAIAEVIANIDTTGQARVQLRYPWYPGIEPWARIIMPSAGSSRGLYAVPQVGDEVLVAFTHGDLREPYVLGSLWNPQDRPPTVVPNDAVAKRMLVTPRGHQVVLEDVEQSITITSITKQKVTIDPKKIELTTAGGTAVVRLETSGHITIQASQSIDLKAPSITLNGTTIEARASGSATIDGGGTCTVQAGLVRIN